MGLRVLGFGFRVGGLGFRPIFKTCDNDKDWQIALLFKSFPAEQDSKILSILPRG